MELSLRLRAASLSAICLVAQWSLAGGALALSPDACAFAAAEAVLEEDWSALRAPSAVLVLDNGRLAYEKYTGFVDAAGAKAWDRGSVSNIGSVSKLFVAAAVLRLQDQGKLSLGDRVSKHLCEFRMADRRYRDITVRMLLNHTSGLPGTLYDDAFLLGEDSSRDYYGKLVADLADEPLKAAPGAYAVYCNEGFILAQKIVERVSKRRYVDYLREEVLAPMGIRGIDHSSSPSLDGEGFVRILDRNGKATPREVVIADFDGTGGLSSDILSLARFGERILSPELNCLSGAAIRLFEETQAADRLAGLSAFNALGWDYARYPFGGLPVFSKSGGTVDYLAQLVVAPEHGLVVAALSTNPSRIGAVAEDLMRALLRERGALDKAGAAAAGKTSGSKAGKKAVKSPGKAASGDPSRHAGKYSFIGGALVLDVAVAGGKLSLSMVPLSQIGNAAGTVAYVGRDDGTFAADAADGKTEKFSFREIDGKTFLVRHLEAGAVSYEVAYAQKLAPGWDRPSWSALDGSVWLKEDLRPNFMTGMQDAVAVLAMAPGLPGHATFVRGTPFRLADERTALTVNETGRDASRLVLDGETLAFRGSRYLPASKAAPLSSDATFELGTGAPAAAAAWYRVEAPLELEYSGASLRSRIVAFGPGGEALFDSVRDPSPWSLAEKCFVLVRD